VLPIQFLELLSLELGQIVVFKNLQNALKSSIEKVFLDPTLLEFFDLSRCEFFALFVFGNSLHVFKSSFDSLKFPIDHKTTDFVGLIQCLVLFDQRTFRLDCIIAVLDLWSLC
jgi:hypothetical protein